MLFYIYRFLLSNYRVLIDRIIENSVNDDNDQYLE